MQKIIRTLGILSLCCLVWACQEDDAEFGAITTPTNLTIDVSIANDQSGNVTVTPSAQGATIYHVFFVAESDPVIITQGEQASFRYTQSGQYSQEIVVVAYGTGGASSSQAVVIDLDVILEIDAITLQNIAGAANVGKRWVWDSSNAGHFGVGDPAVDFPNFFSASPNQLDPCLYDDTLTFMHDGQGNYTFQLDTAGSSFINWAEVKRFFPDATPGEFVDECRDINNQIATDTEFVIVEENGTSTLTVTNSTMSYWSGATSYEIVELTENVLTIRGLQDPFDPPGQQLAWYHTFVPDSGNQEPECDSGLTGNTGSGNMDVLVWADEFNEDGAPCSENWTYDIGTGNGGWGNGESQYYTDRPENIIVEDGLLKITARAESFQSSNYTSSRIKSENLFEFTYGRVDVRAKFPTGGGTWPAIWMLGANFDIIGWPNCGEIDIAEHIGNDQDVVYGTLHYPGMSGGNANGDEIDVPNASTEFHVYSVEWDENEIVIFVDDVPYHTVLNNGNLPFNADFFLILNVAMGGTFGGTIDPSFVESTMEIDYVRVYQ
ncbi:glycoside hydrolase family 16 protein [Aureisphaera galaxeae]|uniref:glycoside hydrolase family 16 protein n=1 Tax=Aureisphaera galaxeae TaxID=1538023 RepID=UPI002350BBA7|nr:glycoside hydrolase family 16 protein [Aureisphaera galaxeae]MDC8005154.1 glycoside hydrolase family 16 protein [Aureisphaera galaxeae]